jgi:hypothetical protein
MDVRLPDHLRSLLSSAVSHPAASGAASARPTAPGRPGSAETAPLPDPEPKPPPEPDPNPFQGRFKIASLMPFLSGQRMFRGPLAGELGELADRAREAFDRLPAQTKGDPDTMRALRDELNGALDELYASHEPGEPIDKQDAVDALTQAFESFLESLFGGDEKATAEEGEKEAELSAERPRLAPRPTREAEPAADAVPADADVAVEQEPTFFSSDQVRDALASWLAEIEERFGDQVTTRDRAWTGWLSQVSGFYARGGEDLLSELIGEAGLDSRV